METSARGVGGARAAGNAFSGKPRMGVRSLWAVFAAAALQRLPFVLLPPDSYVEIKKVLLVLSYLMLAAALFRNLKFHGIHVILFGALLNFAAIICNGGLMPVSPEARAMAGMTDLGSSWLGHVLPEGTGILLTADQTRIWVFTDILPVHLVGGVFSIGDVILGVGLVAFFVDLVWGTGAKPYNVSLLRVIQLVRGHQRSVPGEGDAATADDSGTIKRTDAAGLTHKCS
jgi:hypothetical protein